jgi:hypothetical protein
VRITSWNCDCPGRNSAFVVCGGTFARAKYERVPDIFAPAEGDVKPFAEHLQISRSVRRTAHLAVFLRAVRWAASARDRCGVRQPLDVLSGEADRGGHTVLLEVADRGVQRLTYLRAAPPFCQFRSILTCRCGLEAHLCATFRYASMGAKGRNCVRIENSIVNLTGTITVGSSAT